MPESDIDFNVPLRTVVSYCLDECGLSVAEEVPEGVYNTYQLPALTKDNVIKKWYSTLPQPPVGLPLGYSITECYFANTVDGQGTQVFLIKAKRAAYRNNMPKPFGVSAKINGSKIIFEASNGASLLNQNCYVTMINTRTESLSDTLNFPDDVIEGVFNNVVSKLLQRMQIPMDTVKDDLPQGKKEA